MTTRDDPTPEPPAPIQDFSVVRRGFDPEQVRAYVRYVQAEADRLARDNWELRGRLDAAEQRAANAELVAGRAEQLVVDARSSGASTAQTSAAHELAKLREELQRAMARLEEVEARRAQVMNPGRGIG